MRPILLTLLLAGAATAAHATTKPTVNNFLGTQFPQKNEGSGDGLFPDNGIFHLDGNWGSPYCQTGKSGSILQADVAWQKVAGQGALVMTVPGGTCNAAEIATDRGWSFDSGRSFPYGQVGYGYGYYEMEMMTGYGPANATSGNAGGNGTCESFFLKGLSHGQLNRIEIDFEFLTNGTWDKPSNHTGVVWVTLNGNSHTVGSVPLNLKFNPSAAFHRYGIDFQPGTAKFYIDGKLAYTASTPDATLPADGLLMMANDWTGIVTWGGAPPASSVHAYYRRSQYYAGAKAPPSLMRKPTESVELGQAAAGLR